MHWLPLPPEVQQHYDYCIDKLHFLYMLICELLLALDGARLTFFLLFPHMCVRAACIDVMPVKKETSTTLPPGEGKTIFIVRMQLSILAMTFGVSNFYSF